MNALAEQETRQELVGVKHLAILALVALGVIAAVEGVDGAILGTCMAMIAGLAGYEIGARRSGE